MVIRGVRTRAVNAALGEDYELTSRDWQFNAIFHLFVEVERVGSLVESFLTAEANLANPVVSAASEPQAAAFGRGIVNRDPNCQLEDLAAIRRKDARILVVLDHERARLVPLNGWRFRALVEVLRTPHEQVFTKQLS